MFSYQNTYVETGFSQYYLQSGEDPVYHLIVGLGLDSDPDHDEYLLAVNGHGNNSGRVIGNSRSGRKPGHQVGKTGPVAHLGLHQVSRGISERGGTPSQMLYAGVVKEKRGRQIILVIRAGSDVT